MQRFVIGVGLLVAGCGTATAALVSIDDSVPTSFRAALVRKLNQFEAVSAGVWPRDALLVKGTGTANGSSVYVNLTIYDARRSPRLEITRWSGAVSAAEGGQGAQRCFNAVKPALYAAGEFAALGSVPVNPIAPAIPPAPPAPGAGRGQAPPKPPEPSATPSFVEAYAGVIKQFRPSIAEAEARRYAEWLLQYGREYQVDPRLTLALVAQESRFNPKAKTLMGARGLGLLMPETAKNLGIEDLTDPEQNLRGTIRLLSEYLKEQALPERPRGEVLRRVLACYNAGTGMVRKFNGVPPFPETHHYVRSILGIYYQMLPNEERDFLTPYLSSPSPAVAVKPDLETRLAMLSVGSPDDEAALDRLPKWPRLITPPVSGPVTAPFSPEMRFHPTLRKVLPAHYGVDFTGVAGAPVSVAANGVVRAAAEDRELGKYVVVLHRRGWATVYAHLGQFAVREGQTLQEGEVLGLLAQKRGSALPILHFEVRLNGMPIAPEPLLTKVGTNAP